MNNFNFFSPTRIIFGKNKIEDLGNIAARYGKKCMLVTTNKNEPALKDLYVKAINILESANIAVLHFDEVLPNPPIDIIEKAIALANENNIDFLVGLGGGSSIDTAKSISIFHEVDKINWSEAYQKYTSPFTMYEKISSKKIPLIAIPTTAGTGSEVTQAMMVSEYENNEKNCIFHNEAYPEVALIDPTLCLTIPKRLTAATGFDAFCHAFESYLRDEASDITKAFGIIAIKDIINTLPKLVNDLGNYEYRETMSKAACFAGISLANAAATLPHPFSEIIGGIREDIPHGVALAAVYPGFLKFCVKNHSQKCAQIVKAIDPTLVGTEKELAQYLVDTVNKFIVDIGLNISLSEYNISNEDKDLMLNHFLLKVLPFGSYEERYEILEGAF